MTFEEVYRDYFCAVEHYLLALCKDPALAEELAAETFFKVLQSLDRFRGQCDIRTWLFAVAKNCYFSHLRKADRQISLEQIPLAEDGVSPEQLVMDRQQMMQIHKLLHKLEEPYKEVFCLRVFGQLSFKDIGAIFEKTQNWACVTYHRARQKIITGMEALK